MNSRDRPLAAHPNQPRQPATERRLAVAWAKVLGIPEDQIGRRDHFLDMGGTSLSALRLAIALDRAVSLKDLNDHPIFSPIWPGWWTGPRSHWIIPTG